MPKPLPDPLRALAILAGAVLCALVANAIGPASHRLAWTGRVPDLPPLAAEPQAPPPPEATPAPPASTPLLPAAAPARPAPQFLPRPDAASREISSAEAWAAYQLKAPFLDARRSEDFAQGHVAGARSVPVWEADADARLTRFEAEAKPAPQAPIVVYCGGGGCEDSHLLARKLVTLGYRNLLIYRDGFPDWTAHSRPQASGAQP
jgi:rhodanese-related sulfurtransferase